MDGVARQVDVVEPEDQELEAMPELTAEAILQADDLPLVPLSVPEWQGKVYVRTISNEERDAWEQAASDQTKGTGENAKMKIAGLKARLVALAAADAQGKPLFSVKQITALQQKSASAINRIFRAAKKQAGIGDDEIEELAKNSSDGRKDGPGSE